MNDIKIAVFRCLVNEHEVETLSVTIKLVMRYTMYCDDIDGLLTTNDVKLALFRWLLDEEKMKNIQ